MGEAGAGSRICITIRRVRGRPTPGVCAQLVVETLRVMDAAFRE